MLKSERFMVIDENNHIYFNEFGSDEEIMTLEDAKWLAYELSDGAGICIFMPNIFVFLL